MKKTVLISGINGFLGSNLLFSLHKKYNIIGIERETNELNRVEALALEYVKIYSTNNLDILFEENSIDFIIHTATHHSKLFNSYAEVFETNVLFGMKLLDYANSNGVNCFINMDTILDKNINLYSYTKAAFKESIEFISESYNLCIINIKLDMMYGANSGSHNFINSMLIKLLDNVDDIDLTIGKQRRSFLYINDIVKAIDLIINKYHLFNDKVYNEFHLIHPELNTIEEVMILLKELTNSRTSLNFGALNYRRNEIMETQAEYSIYKVIDWKPEYSIRKGLLETIQNSRK